MLLIPISLGEKIRVRRQFGASVVTELFPREKQRAEALVGSGLLGNYEIGPDHCPEPSFRLRVGRSSSFCVPVPLLLPLS